MSPNFLQIKSESCQDLLRMAAHADAQHRYAQADQMDNVAQTLSSAVAMPTINQVVQNLTKMIDRVDKHYAVQIQTINHKLKELSQSQGANAASNEKPDEIAGNQDITVAPGSNVDIHADNAASAEINL